jgi:hypothetical protein
LPSIELASRREHILTVYLLANRFRSLCLFPTLNPLATRATTIRALARKQTILKCAETLSPYRVHVHAIFPFAGSGSTLKPILPQRVIVLKWAGIERLLVMKGNRTLPFCLQLRGQSRLFRWRHQLWPWSGS